MDLATPLDGPYIAHFKALARELDMAIAAAYLEKVTGPGGEPWPPRNSVALIDRHGEGTRTLSRARSCSPLSTDLIQVTAVAQCG